MKLLSIKYFTRETFIEQVGWISGLHKQYKMHFERGSSHFLFLHDPRAKTLSYKTYQTQLNKSNAITSIEICFFITLYICTDDLTFSLTLINN